MILEKTSRGFKVSGTSFNKLVVPDRSSDLNTAKDGCEVICEVISKGTYKDTQPNNPKGVIFLKVSHDPKSCWQCRRSRANRLIQSFIKRFGNEVKRALWARKGDFKDEEEFILHLEDEGRLGEIETLFLSYKEEKEVEKEVERLLFQFNIDLNLSKFEKATVHGIMHIDVSNFDRDSEGIMQASESLSKVRELSSREEMLLKNKDTLEIFEHELLIKGRKLTLEKIQEFKTLEEFVKGLDLQDHKGYKIYTRIDIHE